MMNGPINQLLNSDWVLKMTFNNNHDMDNLQKKVFMKHIKLIRLIKTTL